MKERKKEGKKERRKERKEERQKKKGRKKERKLGSKKEEQLNFKAAFSSSLLVFSLSGISHLHIHERLSRLKQLDKESYDKGVEDILW